jgi:gliding motility-associated-like protein
VQNSLVTRIKLFLLTAVITTPLSGQYNFTASETEGCTPMKVKYNFVSSASVDTATSFTWDFGNGQTSILRNPDSVNYETAGLYDVTLVVTFVNGGEEWIIKPDYLNVHHTVPANFIYYDTVSTETYVLRHNEPLDAGPVYTFLWNIEGFSDRTGPKQTIVFPDTGTYTVSLTVTDSYGCSDKTTQDILVYPGIIVQNVFTPNGDNVNDYFIVTNQGGVPLILRIFTRTGILVYENEGSTVTWDGLTASGQKVNAGVYFYTIEARIGDPSKKYTKTGFLYLYK